MSKKVLSASSPQKIEKEFTIALAGNPNTGKTSIFNSLTGLRQKVSNYAGVTVEKKVGTLKSTNGKTAQIYDLPGLYSLQPKSLDDKISADALTGRLTDLPSLDLVVIVADASNLERNLYLVTQILDLGKPAILVLNMMDVAEADNIVINTEQLSLDLGIPILPVSAKKNAGIDLLKSVVFESLIQPPTITPFIKISAQNQIVIGDVKSALSEFSSLCPNVLQLEALQLISSDDALNRWQNDANGSLKNLTDVVQKSRKTLADNGTTWNMWETALRYAQIDQICKNNIRKPSQEVRSFSEKLDKILTHRVAGPFIFVLIFSVIFQSVFSWSAIPMDAIDGFIGWLGEVVAAQLPDGAIKSLIVEGIIAGVGSVIIFLPQILFLFFFLSLLEDTGYMARVAFIVDRVMRFVGLSGRSVIPLLSSFACAIPGIMATRTIQSWQDRLITIMIAPLMSCSARLPVYALMIAAFIPDVHFLGIFSLAGITLLSMYLLGIIMALGAGWAFRKFMKKQSISSTFIMELPPYRLPSLRWTVLQMLERAKVFITDAGQIILAISIVLWFLASYPKHDVSELPQVSQIEQSYAGQVGKFIEPTIKPLGFDWKIGIGLITSFAAREVMVSTLATIYNIEDADETSVNLREALVNEKDPITGKPVYTPLTAISLMVFFVIACQCMATVAIVRRETNSWRWPIIMVVYMTVLAYLGSLIVFQGGQLLGWG